jgi:hypothetical protein
MIRQIDGGGFAGMVVAKVQFLFAKGLAPRILVQPPTILTLQIVTGIPNLGPAETLQIVKKTIVFLTVYSDKSTRLKFSSPLYVFWPDTQDACHSKSFLSNLIPLIQSMICAH